ncbi:MAG: hypothetical protein HY302_15225 [Opitutae bacterium]|nr:hypothetical protein [Opitutae bacterium]
MPADPHAQFDETVLEMIERSPVGAVPHTPAYADSLGRLYAKQKIYHDADHKDGHVTARSLAQLPHFQAENLAAYAAGQIDSAELESNESIFERYVQSLHVDVRAKAMGFKLKAAGKPVHHRHKSGEHAVIHDPVHTLFLVPGTGPNRGLPGNYLHGSVLELSVDPGAWSLHLHDSDDGAAVFDAPTLPETVAKLLEVFESAPFHLHELEALGFKLL